MKSLIYRIIKQVKNDKRSLALMLVAPLMILTLINLLLGEPNYSPVVATQNVPSLIVTELERQGIIVLEEPLVEDMDTYLLEQRVDAILTMGAEGSHIRFYEPDNAKIQLVVNGIKAGVEKLNPQSALTVSFVMGKMYTNTFDALGYIFLGILSFFFVFLIAGISFVRERTTGTLERLMMTPIKRFEVVAGYTIGFGIFAAIQSIFIVVFVKYFLKIEFIGSVFLTSVIMILLAFTAVSIGAFVSIFANNEFQIVQFIPVVIVPQIFLSGLIPIDIIPFNLGKLAYITPIYYGSKGIKEVLLYGSAVGNILINILMLIGFNILFLGINTFALKRYRSL